MLLISLGFLPTKFSLSFPRSFSLSSFCFNRFAWNSVILLTPVVKFSIAYVCDPGVWRFSCGLIIILFLLRALEIVFWFSLSHKQKVKGFLLVILFRFHRLKFPYHFFWSEDSAERFFSWKERSNALEDRISMTVFVSVKTGCIIWNHFEPILARSTFFLHLFFFLFFLMLLYFSLKVSIEVSRSACVASGMSFRLSSKKIVVQKRSAKFLLKSLENFFVWILFQRLCVKNMAEVGFTVD